MMALKAPVMATTGAMTMMSCGLRWTKQAKMTA